MKYEIKINGNILKTDDRDVTLEFIKAVTKLVTHQHYVPAVQPIVTGDVHPAYANTNQEI